MTNDQIQQIALANGFKLKEQPDGSMALNSYVFDFARALLTVATPPPVQDEPAAWMYKSSRRQCVSMCRDNKADDEIEMPLYTRPDNEKLRKAAEEVLTLLKDLADSYGFETNKEYDTMHKLQYALEGK